MVSINVGIPTGNTHGLEKSSDTGAGVIHGLEPRLSVVDFVLQLYWVQGYRYIT